MKRLLYLMILVLFSGAIIFLPSCSDQERGTIKGHGYVDLGLSVKWATCNIGADSPEEYGSYYAFGETETKTNFSFQNSVTYDMSMTDFSMDAEYDAATANWGGTWRLPTADEIDELIDKCTWTWTTLNGVRGYEVTGTNGNSIFLPAAGSRFSSSLNNAGSNGHYWSSSPGTSDTGDAFGLLFLSGYVFRSLYNRDGGMSVRPVSD